jgi:hypothetical protein
MKTNMIIKGQEVLTLMRRTDKYTENWLHTLKTLNNKNNQMTGIISYISILTLNVNGLNSLIKRHRSAN